MYPVKYTAHVQCLLLMEKTMSQNAWEKVHKYLETAGKQRGPDASRDRLRDAVQWFGDAPNTGKVQPWTVDSVLWWSATKEGDEFWGRVFRNEPSGICGRHND